MGDYLISCTYSSCFFPQEVHVQVRDGKLVFLSIPLTWGITALHPWLFPSWSISTTGALGWEFQN